MADSIKYCRDELAKQRHCKEALIKYNDVLQYAPIWAALKEADEAEKHTG